MAERTLRRHDTDTTSLVLGLVMLGIAVGWLLTQLELISVPATGLLLPVVLVAAGLAGLVVSVTRVRRGSRPDPYAERYDEPYEPF